MESLQHGGPKPSLRMIWFTDWIPVYCHPNGITSPHSRTSRQLFCSLELCEFKISTAKALAKGNTSRNGDFSPAKYNDYNDAQRVRLSALRGTSLGSFELSSLSHHHFSFIFFPHFPRRFFGEPRFFRVKRAHATWRWGYLCCPAWCRHHGWLALNNTKRKFHKHVLVTDFFNHALPLRNTRLTSILSIKALTERKLIFKNVNPRNTTRCSSSGFFTSNQTSKFPPSLESTPKPLVP